MDEKTLKLCETVCEDRNLLKKEMVWETEDGSLANLSAFLYAGAGKRADVARYKECKSILKDKISAFSEIRGVVRAVVITKMTLSEDPEAYIDGVQEVYKKLRSHHVFTASPYMVLAAITIYENAGLQDADQYIDRLDKVYSLMKSDHPFLTADEDRPMIATMIFYDMSAEEIANKVEANYKAFKGMSMPMNSIQSLAEALAFSTKSPEIVREEIDSLVNGLKAAGKRIDKQYGLAILGLMTTLDIPTDRILAELIEVDDLLKSKQGFKWYNGAGPKMRRLYDCLIVMLVNSKESDKFFKVAEASTMTFIIDMIVTCIVASQAAINAAVVSSASH